MRYFNVTITNADGKVFVPNVSGAPGFTLTDPGAGVVTYSSLNAGANVFTIGGSNPAAQEFHCDIPTAHAHLPQAGAYFRIMGVSLAEIRQAANLGRMFVRVDGGMAAGLPLANPNQSGPLAVGQIIRSYGSWVGTAQALNCYLIPYGSSPSSGQSTGHPNTATTPPVPATVETPANLIFRWYPGQPLMVPLVSALQTAFPQYQVVGAVSPNLVWTGAPEVGFFATLKQLALYIQAKTLSMLQGFAPPLYADPLTPSYAGVTITLANNTITVADGTVQTPPREIVFTDLIGQPSWDGIATVQTCVVMRGDLDVGDYVKMPDTVFTIAGNNSIATGTSTYDTLKLSSVFRGNFKINGLRHVGNSRGAAGQDWATVLDLVQSPNPTSTVNQYPVLYKPSS
jgi:hypothetical protein